MNLFKSDEDTDIDDTLQIMRTLTIAQIRRQLEKDKRKYKARFRILTGFFKDAKEQTK